MKKAAAFSAYCEENNGFFSLPYIRRDLPVAGPVGVHLALHLTSQEYGFLAPVQNPQLSLRRASPKIHVPGNPSSQ